MPDLLLELLCEEIPARLQRSAIGEFCAMLRTELVRHEVRADAAIEGFVTPRRLAVIARDLPSRRPARREERRGPRVGAPEKAVEGFLRAAGLSSIGAAEIRELPGGNYYFAVREKPEEDTATVLPEILLHIIANFPWPKKMRFPAAPLRWVRPINSLLCLFGGEVVPLQLGRVPVGRATRGHRWLAPGEIRVQSPDQYLKRLKGAWVILDSRERENMIRKGLEDCVEKYGFRVKDDPGLLEEVCGLVEYPVVLSGAIGKEFMDLPPEVLATSMRTHQRYFSCLDADGSPAPRFLFVANNSARDGGKAIVAGNERVISARLADARYFYMQDRKLRLEDRVEALKERVYHEKLGSVYEKTKRVEKIADELARRLFPDDPQLGARAARAARLAKADLSTSMVGEFPELQGVMGRYYALNDGEDPRVAQAIADHYKPLGPNDTVPTAPESIVVALADKIDSLVAFFAIGEKPTGSGDPYALRRAALGIIRIILENGVRLRLRDVFRKAWQGTKNISGNDCADELLEFVLERLKVHLREQGVRHDLIAAAFVRNTGFPEGKLFEDDLVRLMNRVRALRSFLSTDDGSNLLVAYRRAANIVAIEERRDGRSYSDLLPDFSPAMLRQPEANALVTSLGAVNAATEDSDEDFSATMMRLATLRRPIDDFFDRVTVNTEETVVVDGEERSLRENRLRLLSAIRATMNRVADFSQIEG